MNVLKKPFLLILLASLTRLYAGGLSLSDTLVNFNDVFVGSAAQATITPINNGATTVEVRYTNPVEDSFAVHAPGNKIAPGASLEISLTFTPKQNIAYTDFLFLRLSAGLENLKCKMLGNGRLPNSYYADSFNKWGAVLKSALHNIIKGHTEHDYGELWDILSDTDEDPNNPNNVILLYTGWSSPKSNHGGGVSNWNREHVWAKSHGSFGTNAPAGTDVHHIRPTDVTVNSTRGNLDFDNGGNKYTDGDGATECYYDNDSWEPRSAVKGDVARMMYYMAVRYEADATGYDLELVENIPSSGGNFAKRSTLYSWHNADPVDDWERSRNEKIYTTWQHNRNPFIDYPQFIDRLPSLSGKELSYGNPSLVMPADSIIMALTSPGNSQSFTLNLANTGGDVLNIRSMQVFDNHFSLSKHSLSIPAESDAAVTLSFSGDNAEGFTAPICKSIPMTPSMARISFR